jgi:hypothetical protein
MDRVVGERTNSPLTQEIDVWEGREITKDSNVSSYNHKKYNIRQISEVLFLLKI